MIGAMTTLNNIAQDKNVEKHYPILRIVSENIASTQIRNMATIGGNVACRYAWTEFASCLIALEATLHFAEKKKLKEISAESFFKNNAKPEGLLTSISIPIKKDIIAIYKRVSKTPGVDLPMLTVCIKVSLKKNTLLDVRVVINDGASFSKRDVSIEKALEGSNLDENIEGKFLSNLNPETYKLDNEYKKELLRIHSKYAIQKLLVQINDNA